MPSFFLIRLIVGRFSLIPYSRSKAFREVSKQAWPATIIPFGLWGRSSNVTVLVPYAMGTLKVTGENAAEPIRRSGLADGGVRFALNLRGGRAMPLREYLSWHEKTTIGVSLTMAVPSGQYDPARLINGGSNRWAFKPELGLTRRWGNWMLDCYGGSWFFTPNNNFYPGYSVRTQAAVLNGETHFGYSVKPRLWASVDGNFWTGGRSTVNGVARQDQERNSRAGATVSIPASPHQSLKISYSRGAYVTIGGNYKTISVAWQYSWLTKSD